MAAARAAGLKAQTLKWTRRPSRRSDLEAAARAARYRLMGRWCRRQALSGLYVAHSREDQAETFLLRLARGSGLDGLAAMQPLAPCPVPGFGGVACWCGRCWRCGRAELRAVLGSAGASPGREDPMNADPRFARVRLRAAWPALEAAGPDRRRASPMPPRHLARARPALEAATADFLAGHARFEAARGLLDGAALAGAAARDRACGRWPRCWRTVSGAAYRPRFERLERLYEAILAGDVGKGRTLQGCRIGPGAEASRAFRRFDAPHRARSRAGGAGGPAPRKGV